MAAEASDANTRTGLNPKRRIRGVVAGLIPMFPTNTADTIAPARSGSQPKPTWNISGSRNGTALMVRRYTKPPVAVARNVRVPKTDRLNSGVLVRRIQAAAAARNSRPAAIPAAASSPASRPPINSRPTSRDPTPSVVRTSPSQSRRRVLSPRTGGTRRSAASKAARPRGRLTRKIQCQDR
ncbi:hypothetical protein SRABI128_05005 [Microbacterium sp. Bi128]|nr:hypothetical protein SRABI128_05005 [Microbacterium sp. Bi128]